MDHTFAVKHTRTQQGFTLLELVTVLAIVGILISMSYPMYTSYIIRTNRAHAHIALFNLATSMERYRLLYHGYQGATLSHPAINADTQNKYYAFKINVAGQNNYQLLAIPQQTQRNDKLCGTLSLDETGRKGQSGTGNVHTCW